MSNSPATIGVLSELLAMLDMTRIEHNLRHLSSDQFAGRRVGTAGHDLAQAWIVERMKSIGLETHLFEFTLTAPVVDVYDLPYLAMLDETGTARRVFEHRTEFSEHPRSADQPVPVRGHGVNHAALPSREAIRGAWIILEAVPQGHALNEFAAQIKQQGAIGLLVPQHPNQAGYLSKRIMAGDTISLPILAVNASLLPDLAGATIAGASPVRAARPECGHVIGTLKPTQEQPALIVGAHFDGVGDDPAMRILCAGDNAAAVAVLLEIARVFSTSNLDFASPIQFMAFDSEEVHAQGSRIYADYLKQTGLTPLPMVINLDGAASLNELIAVEIGAGSEKLVEALEWAGQQLEIPLISEVVSSDNRLFASAGFPAVGIGAGTGTVNIHSPADTIDHVNLQGTLRAARLLLATVVFLTVHP